MNNIDRHIYLLLLVIAFIALIAVNEARADSSQKQSGQESSAVKLAPDADRANDSSAKYIQGPSTTSSGHASAASSSHAATTTVSHTSTASSKQASRISTKHSVKEIGNHSSDSSAHRPIRSLTKMKQ
jgi:hypothetical protein